MSFFLAIHNILRWFILVGLVLLLVKIFFDYVKFYSFSRENKDTTILFNQSKKNIEKLFFFLTIIVNIQFALGFSLYFFNPSVLNLWNDVSTLMKHRELRVIGIEHPLLMIIFVGLIHYLNVSIKKLENFNQYKKVLIIYTIAIIVLILGIPWFRPLIRI